MKEAKKMQDNKEIYANAIQAFSVLSSLCDSTLASEYEEYLEALTELHGSEVMGKFGTFSALAEALVPLPLPPPPKPRLLHGKPIQRTRKAPEASAEVPPPESKVFQKESPPEKPREEDAVVEDTMDFLYEAPAKVAERLANGVEETPDTPATLVESPEAQDARVERVKSKRSKSISRTPSQEEVKAESSEDEVQKAFHDREKEIAKHKQRLQALLESKIGMPVSNIVLTSEDDGVLVSGISVPQKPVLTELGAEDKGRMKFFLSKEGLKNLKKAYATTLAK